MRQFTGRIILATATAALLLTGPAAAQSPAQRDWRERFQVHDRNADDRIDRAEFQEWMVEVFFHRDQAKKGYLTFEDLKDVMTPQKFAAADRNGDGKLWLDEFLNALFQDFEAIDGNKEGSITVRQIQAYIQQRSN